MNASAAQSPRIELPDRARCVRSRCVWDRPNSLLTVIACRSVSAPAARLPLGSDYSMARRC
jgi:hypothetical protein